MGEDINEKPPKLETTYGTHYHENNIWTMVPNDMRKFSLSKFTKKFECGNPLSGLVDYAKRIPWICDH